VRKRRTGSLRFPVVSHSAEYLAIGYLMRRNILAYKAPPHNEGYDLICIHPDPRRARNRKQVRVQVKSRYQTDCDRTVPMKKPTFRAFDYLIIVFLNIGNFYRKGHSGSSEHEPEFVTLPKAVAKRWYRPVGWGRVDTKRHNLESYLNEKGILRIAKELRIQYPSR